jgi:hypothetical protein
LKPDKTLGWGWQSLRFHPLLILTNTKITWRNNGNSTIHLFRRQLLLLNVRQY